MVTHDQSEALAVADRIAVLEAGRLRQVSSPAGLYQQPRDAFVADFIGSVNLFDITGITERGGGVAVTTAEFGEMLFPADAIPAKHRAAKDLVLAVRPEKIRIHLAPPTDGNQRAKGKLGDVAFQGDSSIVEMMLENGREISAYVHEGDAVALLAAEVGTDVWCAWATPDMLVLPRNAL